MAACSSQDVRSTQGDQREQKLQEAEHLEAGHKAVQDLLLSQELLKPNGKVPVKDSFAMFLANEMWWLQHGPGDAACLSCYRDYISPMLGEKEKRALECISWDCRCDLQK